VGRAGLVIFDGHSHRVLNKGERVMLDVLVQTKLTNTSTDKIDVILVTLTSSVSSSTHMQSVSNG
jgi:mannose-1-phosphate guanylyltransferase/mannose-6-phosphate isomerase